MSQGDAPLKVALTESGGSTSRMMGRFATLAAAARELPETATVVA